MLIERRGFLGGAAALGLVGLPRRAAASGSGERRLTLFRGGSEIGSQRVAVQASNGRVRADTEIEIRVRILGLTAYSYDLQSSELWEGGRLVSLRARTNDNGTDHFAEADRAGDALIVRGSAFEGWVEGNPAVTSYWSPAFLERPVWISTMDGQPFNVTATRVGPVELPVGGGALRAQRWRIAGDLSGLDLFYDDAGEWVGNEFDAEGETARFVALDRGARLTPLWSEA